MKKVSVVLFDDNLFFRKSMHIMMEGRKDMKLSAAFKNANNLVRDLKSSAPDLVLMDIEMPGTNGIDAVRILKKDFPKLPVMILSDHCDEEKVFASICAGADGYSLKTMTSKKIIESIHDVSSGNASLCPPVAKKVLELVAQRYSGNINLNSFALSKREKEVLTLLVQGKSYKMIAADLGIIYDTVRAHIKKIYKKLQVSSISGAVSKAITHRIVAA